MSKLLIYNTLDKDPQSKVRGIGRYVKTFEESQKYTNALIRTNSTSSTPLFKELNFELISSTKSLNKNLPLLNPFFNPIAKPAFFFRKSRKQIAVIHDLITIKYNKMYPVGIKGKLFKFLNKLTLKSYDIIVTDSNASKNDIVNIYKIDEKKIHVIYPTVSTIFLPHLDTQTENKSHHHPFKKIANNSSQPEFTEFSVSQLTHNKIVQEVKDYLIYVGDGTWNKNLVNLARVVKILNLPCVFVGSIFDYEKIKKLPAKPHPWQRSYYEFLKFAEGDKRFIFASYVTDAELRSLYKHAKLNLLLSYDEGFGYSYVEASYMSTPSILSDIPIFHEIAKDSAVFVDPNNPNEIAETVNKVYFDQLTLENLKIKVFDRAQDFNPVNFINQFSLLIKNI